MSIIVVGLTHREAPVELRERLAIAPAHLEEALDRLSEYVAEGVIVSTCNRTEVYARVGHHHSGLRVLTRFLADTGEFDEHALAPYLRDHWQEDAARHLFRVAAGLDSMILGEGQVLGQVRQAYDLATSRRPIGVILGRLFDWALVVGKRARTETAIARSAVSISQAAVELARQALGGLDQATVLVIGTGKMGELAARALRERGARRVLVANRTAERASALVEQLGGEAWPFERLDEALVATDIVISSTASDEYVISAEQLRRLMDERAGRELALVDIAVPRDIEPAAGGIDGVHLFNVDDLRGACAANLDQRRGQADSVERIIEDELQKFVRWWQTREVAPTISALVNKAEAIRQEELSRTLARLGPLSERETSALNALTAAIVSKMLHDPITQLKARGAGLDGKHYIHATRELFDLPLAESAIE